MTIGKHMRRDTVLPMYRRCECAVSRRSGAGTPISRRRGATAVYGERPTGIGTSPRTTTAPGQPDQVPTPRRPTHPHQATLDPRPPHRRRSLRLAPVRATWPTPTRHQSDCPHRDDSGTRPRVPTPTHCGMIDTEGWQRGHGPDPTIEPQCKNCRHNVYIPCLCTTAIGSVGQSRR